LNPHVSATALPDEAATIVVGSGPAGAALAGALAEAGESVLLLEAGPDYGPRDDGRWPDDILDASALCSSHDWGYSSELDYAPRVLPFERARVLGGCSSHNGCAAIRGSRLDYDAWAIDNPGWATSDLLPLFEEAEQRLRVRRYGAAEITPFHDACVASAQAAGIPATDDLNDLDENEAIGIAPVNIDGGVRYNAAFAFLDPVRDAGRLTIIGDALVSHVVLDGASACAVAVVTDLGLRQVRASRIVLAAGTYGSPALLQRSGIGPSDVLARAGVDLRVPLAGVGANLHDHPAMIVGFEGGPELERRTAGREGWVPEEQSIAKLRSDRCTEGFDLHLYPLGGPHPRERGAWRWELPVACMTPRSRGVVAIRSADPEQRPRIDHAYLSDPDGHDVAVLADGVEIARRIARAEPLRGLLGAEVRPAVDGEDLERAIREKVEHYYHPVGTCRMGREDDPDAVVDASGRVHGLEGLYVADCSIVPTIPRANTNVPATVIGMHVARRLLREQSPAAA
jgi:choline dehydrogenase